MIDDCLRLAALVNALDLISEAGVSGSVVTGVEADMLLVRGMDSEPGLLGTLIRMRVVAVLGDVGDVGGEGSAEGGMDVMSRKGRECRWTAVT